MASTPKPEPLAEAAESNDAAWLLDQVWTRMNERNEHFVGVFVGREGSGKSLTAIKVAEMVDPRFNPDENIFFKLDNFLEVLAEDEYTAGDMYVLDEAGVQLGNRTWQDRAQVLANQALQLIRDHNVGLIFTLPRLSELDKQARGRLQLMFEITAKNDGQYVKVRPKMLDPDRTGKTGKVYRKYPRREDKRGGVTGTRKVAAIQFRPPSDDAIGHYQQRKSAFQSKQYEAAIAELRDGEPEDTGPETPQEVAVAVQRDEGVDAHIKEYNGGTQVVLDWRSIANTYEMGETSAKRAKQILMDEVDTDVM
jgi:hypothetical protein